MTAAAEARLWHAGAFAAYAVLSLLLLDHGASLTHAILGIGSDPFLFTWFLAWFPYALTHHLNPLYTQLVWQPHGLHLAWTTCVPLLAWLGAPVTLLGGPVLSYNLLTLAAPVLAAQAAYFLCLALIASRPASLLGGALFGFSPYGMAETLQHLNLDFTALIPCLALLALARLQGRLGRAGSVCGAAVLLGLQFYISVEVFATAVLCGGLAWLLAYGQLPARRPALLALLADAALAAPLLLLLALPLLWPMLAGPKDVVIPLGWADAFSAHVLNLLVPSPATVLADPTLRGLNRDWLGLPLNDVAAGLPLLLVLGLFGRTNWGVPAARYGLLLLLVLAVLSLGPRLWLGGWFTPVVLPWQAVLALPLISAALPVRLGLYMALLVAVLVAAWAAAQLRRGRPAMALLAVAAWALLLPAPHPTTPLPQAAEFAPGAIEQVIGSHARVLILPATTGDPSPFWQAENGFGFAQTTGYLGFPPQAMRFQPGVVDLSFRHPAARLGEDIASLCAATGTQYVLAGPGLPADLAAAMQQLAWPRRMLGAVTIFSVVPPPGRAG